MIKHNAQCIDIDLVFTEGFWFGGTLKIEIRSAGLSATLLCCGDENDRTLFAVVSDSWVGLDVPLLDLNNPAALVDFILRAVLPVVVQ